MHCMHAFFFTHTRRYSEAAHDADACLRLQPNYAKARFAKGRGA